MAPDKDCYYLMVFFAHVAVPEVFSLQVKQHSISMLSRISKLTLMLQTFGMPDTGFRLRMRTESSQTRGP